MAYRPQPVSNSKASPPKGRGASSSARKLLDEFKYRGQTYTVPENAATLNITHAVMGEHALRGPMILRWMRAHPDPEERRKEILAGLYNLYGSAISGIKFVDIYG